MSSPMPNNEIILQGATVNLKSVSAQPLVVTGDRPFILTKIFFVPLSITGVAAGDAAAAVGTGAPYTDYPALALGPSATGVIQIQSCDQGFNSTYPLIPASSTINLNVSVADSGATTYTMTVYLMGFYV